MFTNFPPLQHTWLYPVVCLAVGLLATGSGRADEITGQMGGKKVVVSGAVKFENDDWVILETETGAWLRVIKKGIINRVAKAAPPFLPPEQVLEKLYKLKADDPLARVRITPDCIAVLMLESPLPKEDEARVDNVLTKMLKSYDQAAKGVEQFAKKQKLSQKKPAYPAIMRLFESSKLAEKLQRRDSKLVPGVSQIYLSNWYEPVTNTASFSMADVAGRDGSVSEALIWQQLHHTGILKRGAPIPLWFLMGLAAGFETSATKMEPNHLKLNAVTFPGLQEDKKFDWDKMATDFNYYFETDSMYFTDFRDQSWALHWFLMNKNKVAYARYWKTMTELSPLDAYVTERSMADFKKAFGKTPKSFQPLFDKAFQAASQAAPPVLPPEDEFLYEKGEFGVAKVTWIDEAIDTTEIRMYGTLTNVSPLRARSYCVGFSTNWGKQAVWFVDKLEPLKSVELKPKRAEDLVEAKAADKDVKKDKAVKKAVPEGEHRIKRVWVKSVASDSPEAEKWRKGELPRPPGEE